MFMLFAKMISGRVSKCIVIKIPVVVTLTAPTPPVNTVRHLLCLQYRLETFTESRSTDWAYKPHEGTHTDTTQPLTASL